MDGWVGGWMGGRAGLRIAYSNQKSNTFTSWASGMVLRLKSLAATLEVLGSNPRDSWIFLSILRTILI